MTDQPKTAKEMAQEDAEWCVDILDHLADSLSEDGDFCGFRGAMAPLLLQQLNLHRANEKDDRRMMRRAR